MISPIIRHKRKISLALLGIMLTEVLAPTTAYALTGGPSQPEVQSFEPVGTTEMVDLFSGDFVYNIPLLDVEGFPINISYHSGIGMDDEASWVGLGWNINPGVINRNLRGLPDDFNGDEIERETNIKPNTTFGLSVSPNFEFTGKKKELEKKIEKEESSGTKSSVESLTDQLRNTGNFNLGARFGIYHNNYRGIGYEFALNVGGASKGKNGTKLTSGLELGAKTDEGFSAKSNLGLSHETEAGEKSGGGLGFGFNSKRGMNELTLAYNRDTKAKQGSGVYRQGRRQTEGSSTIRVRNIYFSPAYQNQMQAVSVNAHFKVGMEFTSTFLTLGFFGYYNQEKISERKEKRPGYGYYYAQNGDPEERNFLMDFSRTNERVFSKSAPFLHTTSFNYDALSISGEGTGGLTRPYRSDIGIVHDPDVYSRTWGISPSGETGMGNVGKVGLDVQANYGKSYTGRWMKNMNYDVDFNEWIKFDFKRLENENTYKFNKEYSHFENAYFRTMGDMSPVNKGFYNSVQGERALALALNNGKTSWLASSDIFLGDDQKLTMPIEDVGLKQRQGRNQVVTTLTNDEAGVIGLNREIVSYPINTLYMNSASRMVGSTGGQILNRSSHGTGHGIGEVSVLMPDGRRYFYALPAMNRVHQDFVFNVSPLEGTLVADHSKGQVIYGEKANSLENNYGTDNFYRKNSLPGYAHSFLISGVVSADYIDLRQDGITYDDPGSAVKFNYTRVYSNYKWRVPHGGTQEKTASLDMGFKSDKFDDKGSYMYGEKEIWHVHSIESKNYVAMFYISRRADAHQVLGTDGKIDTSASFYKLDSIALYVKQELISGGTTPIKVVHFEYDYSLCPNVENNHGQAVYVNGVNINASKGKLTLKKIYFTYGKSQKGRTAPYQFSYSEFNPEYNIQGYDRWGNYKPTPTHSEIADLSNSGNRLANSDNPYVFQDKDSADLYASAWHLNRIKLPSGGVMNIEYESDDYAFVQNKQAMEMFPVIGADNTTGTDLASLKQVLYEDKDNRMDYLFFRLKYPVSKSVSPDSLDKIKTLYFAGTEDNLYFKFLVDLGNEGNDYDFVSGYAELEDKGFISSTTSGSEYDLGWVKVKPMSRNDKDERLLTQPIALAAMQMLHYSLPRKEQKLFGGYELEPNETNVGQTLRSLIPALKDAGNMFMNPFTRLMRKSAGKNFVVNKSFIRLNTPSHHKLGGGSRVRQIRINDAWNEMVPGGESATYGQSFDYTTTEKIGDDYLQISSGVAPNEPSVGGDETCLRYPTERFTEEKKFLKTIPDRQGYFEYPIGEEFYPPASVGYSKVTTRNLKPSESIYRTGTGRTENYYYTARDFPVRWDVTRAQKVLPKDRLMNFLKVVSRQRAYASQGFSIVLNDMHGKPKGQKVYQEGAEEAYTEVEYHYYSEYDASSGRRKLISEVPVFNKTSSTIGSALLGKTVDMVVDTRHNKGYHWTIGGQSNVDAFLLAIFPAALATWWPGFESNQTDIGTVTTTKVVHEYGILEKTVVKENGAAIHTRNVLFDEVTGEVLMTETQNEFGDPVYNFTYPAHFAYDGMGPAFTNVGMTFKDIKVVHGGIGLANASSFFFPGDEVVFYRNDGSILPVKAWVVKLNSGSLVFVTRSGHLVDIGTKGVNIKVTRSGKRNMHNVPVGSFVSLKNPIPYNWTSLDSVIQSAAVEFSENWKMPFSLVPAMYYQRESESSGGGGCVPIQPCDTSCFREIYQDMLTSANNPFLKKNVTREINWQDHDKFECARDATDGCNKCYPYLTDNAFPATPSSVGAALPAPVKWDDLALIPAQEGQRQDFLMYPSAPYSHNMAPSKAGPSAPEIPFSPAYLMAVSSGLGFDFSELDNDLNGVDIVYDLENCWQMTARMTKQGCSGGPGAPTFRVLSFTQTYQAFCLVNPSNLDETAKFEFTYTKTCGDTVFQGSTRHYPVEIACGAQDANFIVNPYIQGLKGNWRPARTWTILNDRKQNSIPDVRRDGTYSMNSFWRRGTGTLGHWGRDSSGWTRTETMTQYNRTGQNTETHNALNIYSSAVYGFDNTLPTAVSNNARLRQIANDAFEDYDYNLNPNYDHFSFKQAYNRTLTTTVSHTGRTSLRVNGPSDSTYVFKTMLGCGDISPSTTLSGYMPDKCDFNENFRPDTGKYLVSAWVYQADESGLPQAAYTGDTIKFIFYTDTTFSNPPIVQYVVANGPVIDRWQKMDGIIQVPEGVKCYVISMKSGGAVSYFDDFRIHPYRANMRSFVYDPVTLRLYAELDENNYATFYEYDEEGRLIRIKRETERGIVTIKESRTGLKKTDY